jgi:hypothetical protein
VEDLEARWLPTCTVPWPQGTDVVVGRPGAGLVATLDEPDGDPDPGFRATVTYSARNATVTIPAQVSVRGDGKLDILARAVFPRRARCR